jgi:hypothetical protein
MNRSATAGGWTRLPALTAIFPLGLNITPISKAQVRMSRKANVWWDCLVGGISCFFNLGEDAEVTSSCKFDRRNGPGPYRSSALRLRQKIKSLH